MYIILEVFCSALTSIVHGCIVHIHVRILYLLYVPAHCDTFDCRVMSQVTDSSTNTGASTTVTMETTTDRVPNITFMCVMCICCVHTCRVSTSVATHYSLNYYFYLVRCMYVYTCMCRLACSFTMYMYMSTAY